MDYEKIALVSVKNGIVHLDYSFNPDAQCCQDDTTGNIIQLEYYSKKGWNEEKESEHLAKCFWDTWCEWNGKMSGGISLVDDCTCDDAKKLIGEYGDWVAPSDIKTLKDGKYVIYQNKGTCVMQNSMKKLTAADDIDMLINICRQYVDLVDAIDRDDEPTTKVPDPSQHCKYWEEIGASDLCDILEGKYEDAKRVKTPKKHLTDF